MQNSEAAQVLAEIENALTAEARTDFDPETLQHYFGRSRPALGLRNAQTRAIAKAAKKKHPKLSVDGWVAVLDALYRGPTYEHRLLGGMLLADNKPLRQGISIADFRRWVANLEGWAEIDGSCQSIWSGDEMLARWNEWQPFLQAAATDAKISLRRASVVLLCKPVRSSDSPLLSEQAFANITRLQHERDGLITKAVSWLLRELVPLHAAEVATFLDANQSTLPAIAVRETRNKLATGVKSKRKA